MSNEVITLIITSVIWVIIITIIFEVKINDIARLFKRLKPLTPLQKEIREEELTIKQLEAQKADIKRLEDLKRKREALFEEVGDKHAEDAGVRLTSHIVEPDGMTHENTYFCYRCEKNKTLNMMSKENSIILICKECEEAIS